MSLSSPHDPSKPPANKQHARAPSVASPSNEMPVISRPAVTSIKSEERQVAFMEVDPEDSVPEKRSQRKRRVESSLRRAVTLEDSRLNTRQRKRIRYQEIDDNVTDDEETPQEAEVDELGGKDSSRKQGHDRPLIDHKGIIPRAGTKLRTELLTCDRCWSKDLLCVRQRGGQACKECRAVRSKCSRVLPSCPRRRNLTEEDELRWRVLGIEPPNASSVQVRSRSETRLRRASSERSTRRPKQSVSARRDIKPEDDDDSKEDNDPLDKALGDTRRGLSRKPVSLTRRGLVVGFGETPPSKSPSPESSNQRADFHAAQLEGRMLQMEIAMKESARTQKQLARSMNDMSSTLLKMSTEMVNSSSSQRSSADPEMARQLRQLSARSQAITQALDNEGIPLPKADEEMQRRTSKDKALLPRTFQNIGLQAAPGFSEKGVQASESEFFPLLSKISEMGDNEGTAAGKPWPQCENRSVSEDLGGNMELDVLGDVADTWPSPVYHGIEIMSTTGSRSADLDSTMAEGYAEAADLAQEVENGMGDQGNTRVENPPGPELRHSECSGQLAGTTS